MADCRKLWQDVARNGILWQDFRHILATDLGTGWRVEVNEFDRAIRDANEVLKAGRVRCRIELRGDKLRLRGTFPPKPGSGQSRASQQRICLGIGANNEGLRVAIAAAREVGLALDRGQFDWNDFLESRPESIGDWIKRAEADYFRDKERNRTSQQTWEKDYLFVYNRYVETEKEVSLAALRLFIRTSTEPNSSIRRRYVYACRRLANLMGLDGSDLDGLIGSYERKREIPTLSDEVIAKTYYAIPTAQWQWAYGVIATYGLRNHEIFLCHFDDYPLCRVLDGKTGARWAMPCFSEWAEQWRLWEMNVPVCSGDSFEAYGASVSRRFYKYKKRGRLDFSPKDLRTAYGVRLARCQANSSVGAKSMGHSARVHTETYHVSYGKNDTLEQLKLMDSRGDRPQAPVLNFDSEE